MNPAYEISFCGKFPLKWYVIPVILNHKKHFFADDDIESNSSWNLSLAIMFVIPLNNWRNQERWIILIQPIKVFQLHPYETLIDLLVLCWCRHFQKCQAHQNRTGRFFGIWCYHWRALVSCSQNHEHVLVSPLHFVFDPWLGTILCNNRVVLEI